MKTAGELIEDLKKFPKDKPVKIMAWYSIVETDEPEEVHDVRYLKEYNIDCEEVGEVTDFVAIVSDRYHEISSDFP